VKGEMSAPVLVYEIADFQCPYCAQFAPIHARLDSAFIQTGKVQWVFVNLPLPNHARGWAASEAAMCAGAVADRFWPMHDRIFAAQDEWTTAESPGEVLRGYARDAGVPMKPFDECVADDLVANVILADVVFAASTRVSGTPMFIINNEQTLVGLKSYEEWKEILDRQIERRK
jgi:protein-disulfide isomerase